MAICHVELDHDASYGYLDHSAEHGCPDMPCVICAMCPGARLYRYMHGRGQFSYAGKQCADAQMHSCPEAVAVLIVRAHQRFWQDPKHIAA